MDCVPFHARLGCVPIISNILFKNKNNHSASCRIQRSFQATTTQLPPLKRNPVQSSNSYSDANGHPPWGSDSCRCSAKRTASADTDTFCCWVNAFLQQTAVWWLLWGLWVLTAPEVDNLQEKSPFIAASSFDVSPPHPPQSDANSLLQFNTKPQRNPESDTN